MKFKRNPNNLSFPTKWLSLLGLFEMFIISTGVTHGVLFNFFGKTFLWHCKMNLQMVFRRLSCLSML